MEHRRYKVTITSEIILDKGFKLVKSESGKINMVDDDGNEYLLDIGFSTNPMHALNPEDPYEEIRPEDGLEVNSMAERTEYQEIGFNAEFRVNEPIGERIIAESY